MNTIDDFKIDEELNLDKPLFKLKPDSYLSLTPEQYIENLNIQSIFQDATKYYLEKQTDKPIDALIE